jgi:hypothetical protein
VFPQRRDAGASQLHSPSGTRCEVCGRGYLGSNPVLVYRVSECGVQILSRDRSTRAIHKALTTFDQGSCAPALGQRTAFIWGCKSPIPAPFNPRTPGISRSALSDFGCILMSQPRGWFSVSQQKAGVHGGKAMGRAAVRQARQLSSSIRHAVFLIGHHFPSSSGRPPHAGTSGGNYLTLCSSF